MDADHAPRFGPWRAEGSRLVELGSREQPKTNLPAQFTSFIGRRQEMDEMRRLLGEIRLITLTGAGGVGKTRLALEVAAESVGVYAGGVWLVDLAPLADPQLVPQAVASVLSVREAGPRPILETLIATIRHRRLLLILDNCEHLVAACASLSDTLLRSCPDLQILATSRQPLGLTGEIIWRVPSLVLPASPRARLANVLTDSEATRLFVDRAAAALPTFVADEHVSAIVQVCSELDGIPLAIELAAVWIKVLSVEEIAARLSDRFRLLTGGSRTALPRQQTLRGTLDWSYNLLGEAERVLLRRLAAFEGGWTLDAAETVCGDHAISQDEVLDLLAQLVDKSLVLADPQSMPGRYRLLETTRQYAGEYLEHSGEAETIRRRHTDYFLGLAKKAEQGLDGQRQAEWLERLDREHNNLRAALRWCVEWGDGEAELQLAAALWDFWWIRGYLSEGRDCIAGALARDGGGSPGARARALHGSGILVSVSGGDFAWATARFSESVALFRELGDLAGAVRPLADLGTATWLQGDVLLAEALLDEALRMAREVATSWGTGYALHSLGQYRCALGQYEAAAALIEEGVAAYRALGDNRGLAHNLLVQAAVVRGQGDPEGATALGKESLRMFRELWETWGILSALIKLAASAATQRHGERAARLLGAADALSEAIGMPLVFPAWRADFDQAVAAAGVAMEPTAFEAARSAGRAMPLDDAIAYALSEEEPSPARPTSTGNLGRLGQPLSRRECEVAALVARGLTNRQIAEALVIADLTAETHVRNILRKLHVRSRAQVAAWAVTHGVATPSAC